MRSTTGVVNLSTLLATPSDPSCFLPDFERSNNASSSKSAILRYKYASGGTCVLRKAIARASSSSQSSQKVAAAPISKSSEPEPEDHVEPLPRVAYLASVFFIFCLGIVAFLNELLGLRVRKEKGREGYVQLYNWFDTFYQNHLIRRVWSAMFSPIMSAPGPIVSVMERESSNQGWDISLTSRSRDCINLGSYNYLNLAHTGSPCIPPTIDVLHRYGVGNCTNRFEVGTTKIHERLETHLAKFIGVEDSLTFGMGFATNSLNIPSIMNSKTLVMSDQFNHASIILGIKMSSAKIVVFRHNDVRDLEFKLRREIIKAHRLRKPWDKIFIVVEGVYSMHGSMVKLPEVIQIKEKYGAYLYLDEAHCMGGLGANGKGVTQYFGVDPNKVDILMGTFAKSFGAIGGYIAGSKKLINLLRRRSNAHHYGTAMPAAVAAFILEGITFLSTNLEGPARVLNLQRNTRYFRQKMEQMGYIISGHEDSPVVPVTITIGTLRYVVDFMRERNVAAVMVGYPASPLTEGRIRCCMSAQLTKDMIDHVLRCFQELSEQFDLRMSRRPRSKKEIEY